MKTILGIGIMAGAFGGLFAYAWLMNWIDEKYNLGQTKTLVFLLLLPAILVGGFFIGKELR